MDSQPAGEAHGGNGGSFSAWGKAGVMSSQTLIQLLPLLVGLVLAGSGQVFGAPYFEIDDAGQTLDFAQNVELFRVVDSIEGRIEHAFDADLYRLVIDEPIVFSATAVPIFNGAPDLQLFLFDEWGRGVVANDNWLSSSLPQIPVETLSGQSPSLYLLGVAPADDDPLSIFGEIFPDLDEGISVPTGTSRFAPLLDWSRDFTAAGGNYLIGLSGARGVIPPLEADFDGDGIVDGNDLTDPIDGWEARFGVDLDGMNFLDWQRDFGIGVQPLSSAQATPESSSLLLTLVAIVILTRTWRSRG